jgi:hypothetical protein
LISTAAAATSAMTMSRQEKHLPSQPQQQEHS